MRRATISSIDFGLATSEHIDKVSVVDITFTSTKKNDYDGVCHKKLGPGDGCSLCLECAKPIDRCQGHGGKIELYQPVINPLFLPFISRIAPNFCIRCSRLLLHDHHLYRFKSMYCSNYKRKITEMCALTARNRVCWFDEENPKSVPTLLSMKKALKRGYCGTRQPDVWSLKDEKIIIRPGYYIESEEEFKGNGRNLPGLPIITPKQIYEMFRGVSDRNHLLFGFDPKVAPFHAMFFSIFPVPAKIIRPQKGLAEDDLTKRARDIQKANQAADRRVIPNLTCGLLRDVNYDRRIQLKKTQIKDLRRIEGPISSKHTRQRQGVIPECLDSYFVLQRYVAAFEDSKFQAKLDKDYGREIQGVKQRYIATANDAGRVREDLNGKRVDVSARAVISPDTNQEIDEIGLPKIMMMGFTYGEICSMYNFHKLEQCIKNGKAIHPGVNYIERNGQMFEPDACEGGLQFGDVVHRHFVNGDLVLVNRQPSLHKYSLMCHKARLHEGLTIKPHLCVIGAYGGDFDGDEMNILPATDEESRAEAMELLAVGKNLIKDGKLIINFVQHAAIGAYMLTSLSEPFFTRNDIFQYLMQGLHDDLIDEAMNYINPNNNHNKKHKLEFSGQDLVSFILPTYLKDKPLTKSSLNHCFLQLIQEDPRNYDNHVKRMGFIARILKYHCESYGISIGLEDYRVKISDDIVANSKKLETKANELSIKNNKLKQRNPDDEHEIITLLSRARDLGGINAMEYLQSKRKTKDNGFLNTIESGAKGGPTHITQTTYKVGIQLNDVSQRNTYKMNYYFKDDISAYGHVSRCFLSGLTSLEFYLHLISARIGLIGSAIKTSVTGYLNRKIVKFVEDLQAYADGSIRNANGQIIMFHYGFDTSMLFNFQITLTQKSVREIIDEFYFVSEHNTNQINQNQNQDSQEDIVSSFQEISKLLILRYRLLQQHRMVNSIPVPVDTNVLIRLLKKQPKKNSTCSLITIREAISELWLHLVLDYHIPNTDLYEAAFFECFAVRNLFKYGALQSMEHFKFTLEWISRRYIQQLCQAGAPKGQDAVQGLVEPSTQGNLKIFHISGEANVLVDGVQRLGEIVNALKTIATPWQSIYILKEFETTFDPLKSLVELYIDSIVLNSYDKIHTNKEEKEQEETELVVLTLYLNRNQMLQRRLSPKNLRDKLIRKSKLLNREIIACNITYANIKDDVWWITLQIHKESKIIKGFSKSTEPLPLLSLQLYHALRHEKTLLAGVSGIKDFHKSYKDVWVQDESNNNKLVKEKRLCYETKGSNLMGVCLLDEVDIENTTTNDIHQIYQVFGIDPTKRAIEQQLYETMMEIDGTISSRHISLVASVMCASGVLTALTFSGMNSSKHCCSYLKLSTFERSLDSFVGAAISGHHDELKGVSESSMVGTKMSLGTGGSFEPISDLTLLPKCHAENIKTIIRNGRKYLFTPPNIDEYLKTEQNEGEIEEELLSFKLTKMIDGTTKNLAQKRKAKKLDVKWGLFENTLCPSSPKQSTKSTNNAKKRKANQWNIDISAEPFPT